jgi:hypothetical protein
MSLRLMFGLIQLGGNCGLKLLVGQRASSASRVAY